MTQLFKPPLRKATSMTGSRAQNKDANISVVTTGLVKLVLGMPYEERSSLLKKLENEKINIAVVTERLLKFILKMPFAERKGLLEELEEGIARGKRNNSREEYFMDVIFVIRGKAFKGFIRNISAHGVFVETSQKFSVGQRITLSFALPNSKEHIKITGDIARTLPWGFDIRFNEVIRDFLKRYYKKNKMDLATEPPKVRPPKKQAPLKMPKPGSAPQPAQNTPKHQ
jgi:Tfp pilus assembly protein PilZ